MQYSRKWATARTEHCAMPRPCLGFHCRFSYVRDLNSDCPSGECTCHLTKNWNKSCLLSALCIGCIQMLWHGERSGTGLHETTVVDTYQCHKDREQTVISKVEEIIYAKEDRKRRERNSDIRLWEKREGAEQRNRRPIKA